MLNSSKTLSKSLFLCFQILLFILLNFTFSKTYSQSLNKIPTDSLKLRPSSLPNSTQSIHDIIFEYADKGIILLKIVDEGNGGSLLFGNVDNIDDPTNKLFNFQDDLYFGETKLNQTFSGTIFINDLTDAKYDSKNLFLGEGAGQAEDGTGLVNENTGIGKNALNKNTTGYLNSAFGIEALFNNVSGDGNTAAGRYSLQDNLGDDNSALGRESLSELTNGNNNTAIGYLTQKFLTTGNANTSLGFKALNFRFNPEGNSGDSNSAFGHSSLQNLKNGSGNSAIGKSSLSRNIDGNYNSGVGFDALLNDTLGIKNTSFGAYALKHYINGEYLDTPQWGPLRDENVGIGFEAGYYFARSWNTLAGYKALGGGGKSYNVAIGHNTMQAPSLNNNNILQSSIYNNIAIGADALEANRDGINIAIGYNSLNNAVESGSNAAVGANSHVTDNDYSSNASLGYSSDPGNNFTTSIGANSYASSHVLGWTWNETSIGYGAGADYANRIRFGNDDVTRIGGNVAWSVLSDGRFKQNIREDIPGLNFILSLNPVSYNMDYDKLSESSETDVYDNFNDYNEQERHVGFIAQEVENTAESINYDFSGINKPEYIEEDRYTLNYAEFVVPIVRALQERQKKIELLQAELEQLKRNN